MLPASSPTTSPSSASSDRPFFIVNAVVSAAALAFLAYLLMIHRGSPGTVDLRFMPAVNATLNGLSASLLVAGWLAIKNKAPTLHKYCMVSAFSSSALFLVGYVAYHYVHGDTKYQGTGPLRTVYLLILASHVLLSMAVVPLSLTAFYFAFKKAFARHKKVTRWALPIWLYVSVTGVVVFFMLRGSAPAVP
jgi:putative membrane protein